MSFRENKGSIFTFWLFNGCAAASPLFTLAYSGGYESKPALIAMAAGVLVFVVLFTVVTSSKTIGFLRASSTLSNAIRFSAHIFALASLALLVCVLIRPTALPVELASTGGSYVISLVRVFFQKAGFPLASLSTDSQDGFWLTREDTEIGPDGARHRQGLQGAEEGRAPARGLGDPQVRRDEQD
jgi:hypothetical protein